MNNSSERDALELEVENFGPIVKAKIDLRPLTVFVGPSNTGKSYLAILIYALHQHFNKDDWVDRMNLYRKIQRDYEGAPWANPHDFFYRKIQKLKDYKGGLPRKSIDELTEWAQRTFADRSKTSDIKQVVLPDLIADEVRSQFAERGVALGEEILRCLGADGTGALTRKGSSRGARVVLRRRPSDAASFEHGLTIRARGAEFEPAIPKGRPLRIDARVADMLVPSVLPHETVNEPYKLDGLYAKWLIADLVRPAIPHLIGPLHRRAFYLPADRTGVMHAHSVVVRALIGNAAKTVLRPDAPAPMLSGVLADFLEELVGGLSDSPYLRENPNAVHAARIEDAILHGAVHMEKAEISGYPRFTYQPKGWKERLPLMRVSSMVSELAPVVLYLRYTVTPGDVLIVEEPEAHLHPAMQVEFTRQLAALVQSGVRVIVTTHSEWVLEELANIVRRSKLPGAKRKKTNGEDIALGPEQVGAWLFKQKSRPKGSIVEEVKLDDETGLYPADYDEVSEELYNESVNIFNRIQEARGK